MSKYKTLNDAMEVVGLAGDMQPGDTEIWYLRRNRLEVPILLDMGKDWTPNQKQFDVMYVLLGKITCGNFERIFNIMQGEMWSPEGQANELIRGKGLVHTSMSVGDIIKSNGVCYICRGDGWDGLTL